MPHFAFSCPFRELHLGHERWFDPSGYGFILDPGRKRRSSGLQLYQFAVQFLQGSMAEARPNMADVSPGVVLAHSKDQRSKVRPRPFGSSKSRNDNFLTFRSLYFEPIGRAPPGHVSTSRALSHDPLKALTLSFFKELLAESFAVAAKGDQLMARQDLLQSPFAVKELKLA